MWIFTNIKMVVQFLKRLLISNFIKFRPTAFELKHADDGWQTDRSHPVGLYVQSMYIVHSKQYSTLILQTSRKVCPRAQACIWTWWRDSEAGYSFRRKRDRNTLFYPTVYSKRNWRPWHSSGGYSPVSHRGGQGSSPGQVMWDLWWTKSH
jgi:hypothetical protein